MRKFMVPKKGVKIRDPQTGVHLPEEGASRNVTTYFDRRVKDGDLEYRDAPKPKRTTTSKKSKPKDDGEK